MRLKPNGIYSLIAIFVILGFGACKPSGSNQNEDSVKQLTQMKFEKTTHAFGDIKPGETVGCYFDFTNSGEHPLIIDMVKPGCGCTLVKYPEVPIMPGEKGEIEVRFESMGFSGHQNKLVRVYANIENGMKELVISANVIN